MNSSDARESKLLATLLNVLMASVSDAPRLSRGRTYARQRAVFDLAVDEGVIAAKVQGSRYAPYDVLISVAPARQPVSVKALVPTAREVTFECSCPDWDAPCKHAIAAMIMFAEEVAADPELLARWRAATVARPDGRAVAGSRAARGPHAMTVDAVPRLTDEQRAALATFLGAVPAPTIVSPPSRLQPPSNAWDEPWSSMLEHALASIASS